jgi:signal transduction histidine kinase
LCVNIAKYNGYQHSNPDMFTAYERTTVESLLQRLCLAAQAHAIGLYHHGSIIARYSPNDVWQALPQDTNAIALGTHDSQFSQHTVLADDQQTYHLLHLPIWDTERFIGEVLWVGSGPLALTLEQDTLAMLVLLLHNYELSQNSHTIYQLMSDHTHLDMVNTLTQNLPVALLLVGADQSILMANDHLRKLFDFQDKIYGLNLKTVLSKFKVAGRGVRTQLLQALIPNIPNIDYAGTFELRKGTDTLEISWNVQNFHGVGRSAIRMYHFYDVSAANASERIYNTLVRRIRHEIYTPLTAIKLNAQNLVKENVLDAPTRTGLETIMRRGNDLAHMLEAWLLLMDVELGQYQLQTTEADFNNLVAHALKRLHGELSQHHVRFDKRPVPTLQLDVMRIQNVIEELIRNAAKFTPPNTEIHLHLLHAAERAHLPPHAPSDLALPCVLLLVQDQGPGVPTEEQALVFQAFYRPEAVTRIAGYGMGLAVVRAFAQAHDGALWAHWPPPGSVGTTFVLALPLR